jgi:outer membrane lipoprotein SlyB
MNKFEPKSHHMRTLGLMIGGAIAGHEVAKHTGRRHGGLIGAVGGYALSQSLKTDITVPAGTVIEVKFEKPATTGDTTM